MKQVVYPLSTTKYTKIYEDNVVFNAPHDFLVTTAEPEEDGNEKELAHVHFQEGPIKENGVNGVCNEDLITMVIRRLQSFQESEYACRENALAITKLEEALLWLRYRTMGREQRNVEGTSKV